MCARLAGLIGAQEIADSPAWLPLELAGEEVRLLRLDEAAYRAASFLDQRLLALGYEERRCTVAALEAAARTLSARAHFLFHIGHVGSTLIARLLGEHRGYFVLREPAVLRALAAASPGPVALPALPAVVALLSRTWRSAQQPLIKLTSFANELASDMLRAVATPAAVCMFVQPLQYLRTILAGENSRTESRQLAPARLRRLARRAQLSEWRAPPHSEGEWIAMSWLCEMFTLREASHSVAGRIMWVDFDAFLLSPARALQSIFGALGQLPSGAEIDALVQGPLMQRYSKAPEHAYDAALRSELLEQAGHEHASEIGRGMRWLESAAVQYPVFAGLLAWTPSAGRELPPQI